MVDKPITSSFESPNLLAALCSPIGAVLEGGAGARTSEATPEAAPNLGEQSRKIPAVDSPPLVVRVRRGVLLFAEGA